MITTIFKIKHFSYPAILSMIFFIIIVTYLSCVSDSTTGIGTPVLVLPQDGSTITQNPPLFVWHSVDGIVGYNLQVTDDTPGNLDAIIIDISCHPDTSFLPSTVFGSGSYDWRVQAVEGG